MRAGGERLLKVTSGSERRCDGVPSDRSTDPIEGSVAQVCLSQTNRKDRRRTHPRLNTRSSLLEREVMPDCLRASCSTALNMLQFNPQNQLFRPYSISIFPRTNKLPLECIGGQRLRSPLGIG